MHLDSAIQSHIWMDHPNRRHPFNTLLRHDTPMSSIELSPRSGFASPSEINRYQRKVGSILFAAVTTRPDTAFASSRLARFLTNPGSQHQDAADRVLLYLQETHTRALQLGGEDSFEVASDASFADNTPDRKSSQGYIIKLFGADYVESKQARYCHHIHH